jgi:hypothetical protein
MATFSFPGIETIPLPAATAANRFLKQVYFICIRSICVEYYGESVSADLNFKENRPWN